MESIGSHSAEKFSPKYASSKSASVFSKRISNQILIYFNKVLSHFEYSSHEVYFLLLECVNLVSTMLSNLCLNFIVDCGIENRKYFRCDTVQCPRKSRWKLVITWFTTQSLTI